MDLQIYISQGSNHFITNFPRNVPVKTFWKFGEDVEKVCGLFFGPHGICYHFLGYLLLSNHNRQNYQQNWLGFHFCVLP